MQVTKNYGLIKQELTDAADITQISQNWDKVDTELKKLDDEKFDKAGGTITGATTVNGKITAKGGLTVTGGTTTDTLNATGAITVGSVKTTGNVSAGSMTVTGDVTVNGKVLTDNIRAKTGSNALQVGVNNPNSVDELLGIIAQWVGGTTPRVSVTHHPDKASNDKSVATTYWIKQLIATQSEYGLVKLASEEDLLNEAPQNAICTELIYDINEFRRKSKAYKVGEKVDCAFQYERFLECTKAGTTSANLLDTRNVTHGQKIVDGTVEWTVRTHARSVNGAVADSNGNVAVTLPVVATTEEAKAGENDTKMMTPAKVKQAIEVQAPVKTVNTSKPDASGNVTVDIGVKTVNGATPDSKGNVNVQAGIDDVGVKKIVLDTFFPVGSTYISIDANFNPNNQFGGTWSKIENRFLLGSGTRDVGQQGGVESVTLTVNQIPAHSHSGSTSSSGNHSHIGGTRRIWDSVDGQYGSISDAGGRVYAPLGRYGDSSTYDLDYTSSSGSHSHTINLNNTGGGQAHENMPPFEVVNIWKRIA